MTLSLPACGDLTHGAHEFIQVRDCGVDVWRDADAVNLFVVDADGVDLVAVEQGRHQLVGGDAFDADSADGAGEARVEGSVQFHSGDIFYPRCPVVLQVKDALLLALGTYGL